MKQAKKHILPDDEENALWSETEALELWKYFGSIGTADKNTMVTVVSWLLGLSAAIIGYIVTNLPISVTEPFQAMYLALLGCIVSGVAGYVSLLYGGYSNWNWAQADDIAHNLAQHKPKWRKLLPENSQMSLQKWMRGKRSINAFAMKISSPANLLRNSHQFFRYTHCLHP